MRVFLHTFGCKANQYDTELVRLAVERAGATVVTDPRAADAAVVNSCTVTHVAEAKMRGLVRRMARGRQHPRTVVMGCAAAVDDGAIAALPGVAGVVPGADVHGVLRALGLPVAGGPMLDRFAREGRAWLRIQDGCDEHCTFCATTLARGANRSRAPAEIVAEATSLAARHAEIVLTGIHIGTYGGDLDGVCLSSLVEHLVADVPGVRFRLSSIEATEVDEPLAELMAAAPHRLAPHLHAPLQSGSDGVLRRMGRHWYTARTYRARIERLAGRLPVFGLGADVMVGFPGETPADHQATVSLVESLPFTYLHVFPYSARPGTAALRLGSGVPPRVADARSRELRQIADRKGRAYRSARDGRLADVVLCGRARGWFDGLTEDYLNVRVPSDEAIGPRLSAVLRDVGGHLAVERPESQEASSSPPATLPWLSGVSGGAAAPAGA
jgi:threonylcarbamoyladenosine tRNA methylthiotransferase MtaB